MQQCIENRSIPNPARFLKMEKLYFVSFVSDNLNFVLLAMCAMACRLWLDVTDKINREGAIIQSGLGWI